MINYLYMKLLFIWHFFNNNYQDCIYLKYLCYFESFKSNLPRNDGKIWLYSSKSNVNKIDQCYRKQPLCQLCHNHWRPFATLLIKLRRNITWRAETFPRFWQTFTIICLHKSSKICFATFALKASPLLLLHLFASLEKIFSRKFDFILGCRHSSVDSSAPNILPPRVRVSSRPSSMLFFIYSICAIFVMWK